MGVRILRVRVAAAPGTGVGSALSSVEQLAATVAAAATSTTSAVRVRTPGSLEDLPQVIPQLLGAARMPQFSQSLGFDLPNPFAGHPELATNLFQRALATVVESKTQGDNPTLTLR